MTKDDLERQFPAQDLSNILEEITKDNSQLLSLDKSSSKCAKYSLQEWQLKIKEDATEAEGGGGRTDIVRVYRMRNKILSQERNPFAHKRFSLHELLGESDPSKGCISLVMDVLLDLAQGLNRSTSMALHNLLMTSTNKRVILSDNFENPEALTDNNTSVLKLKPGKTLQDSIMALSGQEVSPAFSQIQAMLSSRMYEVSGSDNIPAPGATADTGDMLQTGFNVGLLRRRVKSLLKSVAYNLIMNAIQFSDSADLARNFRIAGVGPSYVSFNPAIFQEIIIDLESRFTISVSDEDVLPENPTDRVAMITGMAQSAGTLSQQTGLPLSTTLLLLPSMPGRNAIARAVLGKEIELERQRAAAVASGAPDPSSVEADMAAKKARADGIVEILKKAFQKLADTDPMGVAVISTNGALDILLKIGQGLATQPEVQSVMQRVPPQLQDAVQQLMAAAMQQQQVQMQQQQQMQVAPPQMM